MSVSVQNLSIRHGKNVILQDVTLHAPSGQITGLIGPNGVGKSSLLKAMAAIAPCDGDVLFDGERAADATRRQIFAYMPQDSSAGSSLTLTEVVLLGRLGSLGMRVSPDLISQVQKILSEFGLDHLSYRTLEAVSGGQRQLAYLAQALFREPKVLMLDEPTAALDLRHQLVVFETLRKLTKTKNITIIVALHDLALAAQFCDQLACLSNGRLDACGAPQEVLTEARLARVYGIEAEVQSDKNKRLRVSALRAL